MATALTPEERAQKEAFLAAARAAYHSISIGQQVKEFRDQNGETVIFQGVSRNVIYGYITELELALGTAPEVSPTMRPPLKFIF